MIHPYLLYGITICGNTFETDLKRLKSLQNKAVKVIGRGQYLDDLTAYYKQLNIWKIEDPYTLEVAKVMHKFSRYKLPNIFSSFFRLINAIHARITRLASSNLNLYIPWYRTVKMQRFDKFQGVSVWNSVPHDMKILSFDCYKIQFKQHLMSNYQWLTLNYCFNIDCI